MRLTLMGDPMAQDFGKARGVYIWSGWKSLGIGGRKVLIAVLV